MIEGRIQKATVRSGGLMWPINRQGGYAVVGDDIDPVGLDALKDKIRARFGEGQQAAAPRRRQP